MKRVSSPAPKTQAAATTGTKTPAKPKSFYEKYIAPNVFNFYPYATIVGLCYYAAQNRFSFDATMSNGGDRLVFLLCGKVCLIHMGLAHLFMTKTFHASQGLTETPGSLMFENELGAVCLCFGISAILAGGGPIVATIAKSMGGVFYYAAARHVYKDEPMSNAVGGFALAICLCTAGFHVAPLNFSKVF